MASEEFHADLRDLCGPGRYGDDTPPLVARVPDPPPSHWGKMTSQSRTTSPQYMEFLKKHKEVHSERQ
jgi:hypothetical protein